MVTGYESADQVIRKTFVPDEEDCLFFVLVQALQLNTNTLLKVKHSDGGPSCACLACKSATLSQLVHLREALTPPKKSVFDNLPI